MGASTLDDMLDGGGSGRLNNISNNYTVVGFGASIFDDMLDGGGAGRLPGAAATSTTTYQTGDGGTVHITRYIHNDILVFLFEI